MSELGSGLGIAQDARLVEVARRHLRRRLLGALFLPDTRALPTEPAVHNGAKQPSTGIGDAGSHDVSFMFVDRSPDGARSWPTSRELALERQSASEPANPVPSLAPPDHL